MKHVVWLLTTGALLSTLMGCSNQWREIDGEVSSEDMDAMFNSVSATSSDSAMDRIKAMKSDPNTAIYFAGAPGELGPVVSVASLYRFGFLGASALNLNYWDIAEINVFLLDRLTTDGHEAGLLIGYKLNSSDASYVTHAFVGTAGFSGGKYRAVFGNTVAVESYDVVDGDLSPVIQLKVFDFDGQGNQQENGQFSTLVGFGG